MASFIQEPDMRTLVDITECVYAMRQKEVKSCSALYAVTDNEAAHALTSTAKGNARAQTHHTTQERERPHRTQNEASGHGRRTNATPRSVTTPVSSCTSSISNDSDASCGSSRRHPSRTAELRSCRSLAREAHIDPGRQATETVAEEMDEFSVEESSLRYSWRREDRFHFTKPTDQPSLFSTIDENTYESTKRSSHTKREPPSKVYGDDGNTKTSTLDAKPRTWQLNIAPLPPSTPYTKKAALTSTASAPPPPPRSVCEEGSLRAKKPASATPATTTTSTTTAPTFTTLNCTNNQASYDIRQRSEGGGASAQPQGRSSGRPTQVSIHLSDLRPPSAAASQMEAQHTDDTSGARDPRAARPSLSSQPASFSDHSQRASHPQSSMWSITPSPYKEAESSTHAPTRTDKMPVVPMLPSAAAKSENNRHVDHTSREALRDSRRLSSTTTASSAQSASPFALTAAAWRGEASVASHGPDVSRVSMRSATTLHSNPGSPAPTAPLSDAASLSAMYTNLKADNRHRHDRGATRSRSSISSVGRAGSMRRDRDGPHASSRLTGSSSIATERVFMDPRLRPLAEPTAEGSVGTQKGKSDVHCLPRSTGEEVKSHDALQQADKQEAAWARSDGTATRALFARYTAAAGSEKQDCATQASRGAPRLVSPPQRPRFPLRSSSPRTPPFPSHESFDSDGDLAASTKMLRAAVHRMRQAQCAAMDASAVSTPRPSATEDRYALLVESARLLSSSVLVFTALAPGDQQNPVSAVRSASAVYRASSPRPGSRPSHAVPVSLGGAEWEEPLAYTSLKSPRVALVGNRSAVKESSSTSPVVSRSAELRDGLTALSRPAQIDERSAEKGSASPPPRRLFPTLLEGSAPTGQAEVRRGDAAEGDNSRLAQPLHNQTMLPSTSAEASVEDVLDSISSRFAQPSVHDSAVSATTTTTSFAVDAMGRRRAVPAPDMILETSQVGARFSPASSTRPRSSSQNASVIEHTHTEEEGEVRLSSRSDTSEDRGCESQRREAADAEELHHAASGSSHSSATREMSINPVPLHSTLVFNGAREAQASGRNGVAQHRELEVSATQRRYYSYVSPVKTTAAGHSRDETLYEGPASFRGVSASTSLFPPPPLATSDYHRSSPYRGVLIDDDHHCAAHTAEGYSAALDSSVLTSHRDRLAVRLETPLPSPLSPLQRMTVAATASNAPSKTPEVLQGSSLGRLAFTKGMEPPSPENVFEQAATNVAEQYSTQVSQDAEATTLALLPGDTCTPTKWSLKRGEAESDREARGSDVVEASTGSSCDRMVNSVREGEAAEPRQRDERHGRQPTTQGNLIVKSSSFSCPRFTPFRSTESSGSAFEWMAEDFAAAHHHHRHGQYGNEGSAEDGGSPFTDPSASEGRRSFGQAFSESSVHRRHASVSLPTEAFSASDFSASAAPPSRERHSAGSHTAGLMPPPSSPPVLSARSLSNAATRNSTDQLPLHELGGRESRVPTLTTHHATASLSFMGSFASIGVQSTASVERTPTAPSMSDGAAFEMSSSASKIPRVAAFFAGQRSSSVSSLPVRPFVDDEVTLRSSESVEKATVDAGLRDAVNDGDKEDKGAGDVLWVDEAGRYFTQPSLVNECEEGGSVVPDGWGRTTTGRGSLDPCSEEGSSRTSTGRGAAWRQKSEGSSEDEKLDISPRSSRQSTRLHSSIPHPHDWHRRHRHTDDNADEGAAPRLSEARASTGRHPSHRPNGIGADLDDDAPSLRVCYAAAAPAPVFKAQAGNRAGTTSSRECSSMSSASTSPEQSRASQRSDREAGQRLTALPSAASPLLLPKVTGDGGDHREDSTTSTAFNYSEEVEYSPRRRRGRSGSDEAVNTDDRSWPAHVRHHTDVPGIAGAASVSSTRSSSSHLPPPPPLPAVQAAPRTRLSVPSALSKPPMAPTSSRPRLAAAAPPPRLLSPSPTSSHVLEGSRRDGAEANIGGEGRGHSFTDEADFFDDDDEEGEDGYCGYGYGYGDAEMAV